MLIATPVSTLGDICRTISPFLQPDTVVSDVGSTKQSALAAFAEHLPQHLPQCVAAHPIAGSDRSGALAAQFGLYQDKKLILCPHETQNPEAEALVGRLWQAVGAQIFRMSAQEHDAVFAAVSHLPHILAFAYVHQILDHADGATYLDFAATGFRDFTRIASSHPAIWTDICFANRDSLLKLIEGQQRQLEKIASPAPQRRFRRPLPLFRRSETNAGRLAGTAITRHPQKGRLKTFRQNRKRLQTA